MMNALEALLSIAQPEPHSGQVGASPVVAIVRLSGSRRSWFVTGVRRQESGVEVIGYAPGCMHSSGSWFALEPGFFEMAAEASGDRLEVDLLKSPVPLDLLEDDSL